jgi:protein-S-isoprenylcysteine O-methyltransferase Ste14
VLAEKTIRIVAAAMAVCDAGAWVLVSRWERGGRDAKLRETFGSRTHLGTRVLSVAGDTALIAALVYPVLVAAAPSVSYGTATQWSGHFGPVIQMLGIAAWSAGLALALWSARTIGPYVAVDGIAVDHQLVTRGPYGRVRHPLYAAFVLIGVGVALVFLSYLVLALAALVAVNAVQWARLEDRLLGSAHGFGTRYEAYMAHTGRFLPRLHRH